MKRWSIGIALLLALTCAVAVIHLSRQEKIECMQITQGDRKITVTFADLEQSDFFGELVDGKGDVTSHEYTGILLRELLEGKGLDLDAASKVTVTSADNYSVEFTGEEVLQADKVYAAVTADGTAIEGIDPGSSGVQIIVFGDANSRRCVRFAQRIAIE